MPHHSTIRHFTASHSTSRHITLPYRDFCGLRPSRAWVRPGIPYTALHSAALHAIAQHHSTPFNPTQETTMAINASIATVTIKGITPMTQSHQHDEPKLDGENANDYDIRTWRHKLNTATVDGKRTIVIPAHGVHQCIAAAAKYSKRQIPGQGKATWTAKFTAGISLLDHPALNINPDDVSAITISANADGVRGSGKRVPRRFPVIPAGWVATFDILILDPIITKDIFAEMMELAGMFIGLGQFRPQNGGTNGRFTVTEIDWKDNRRLAA